MKKTLAIAIAAAMTIPVAAMADTTLYGSLHSSLDIVDLDQGGNDDTNVSHSSNKSFIGVKGSEKISDGLKAVYKAEFGVALGSGGSTLSNRDQYVGLKGNAGTIIAGRGSTPFKGVSGKADLFWYSQLGTNRTLNGDDLRLDNMIAYSTPKIGGFSAKIAHYTEQGNNDQTTTSAAAFYKAGGLMIGAGVEDRGGADDMDSRLMASYDTGKVKVVGFAEDVDKAGTANDRDVYGIGAKMKTAKGAIKGQYYVSNGNGANNDSSMIALGYDHKLSKRTTVYAIYAGIDNDTNARFNLGGGGGHSERVATTAGGQDQSGISLGIKHDF